MLAVHDGFPESSFSKLKKLRVLPASDRRRIQTKHTANGKSSVAQLALSHGHKPACSENFIRASWAGLLLRIEKSDAMKHECPLALLGHEHVVRSRIGLGGGSGRRVSKNLFDESRGGGHVHIRHGHGHLCGGLTHALHASLLHGNRSGCNIQARTQTQRCAGYGAEFAGKRASSVAARRIEHLPLAIHFSITIDITSSLPRGEVQQKALTFPA